MTGLYSGGHTDYRAAVQYQWTPDVMTYAQFSTGFKGGGISPRPYVPEQVTPFGPETLTPTKWASRVSSSTTACG